MSNLLSYLINASFSNELSICSFKRCRNISSWIVEIIEAFDFRSIGYLFSTYSSSQDAHAWQTDRFSNLLTVLLWIISFDRILVDLCRYMKVNYAANARQYMPPYNSYEREIKQKNLIRNRYDENFEVCCQNKNWKSRLDYCN